MKLLELLKLEFSNFGKYEKIIFPLVIIIICTISAFSNDSIISTISAICGISYTILAGKGRILCYFIGILGTLCYAYLAYINGFYGNLALYILYYFPMEIIGIYKWSQHLKSNSREIVKTRLSKKEFIYYSILCIVLCIVTTVTLSSFGGKTPIFDAITTILSIFALFLTIRRCIEQWYIWFIVNLLSSIMWINACLNGANCIATALMWLTYFFVGIYFAYQWHKEMYTSYH